MYAPGMRIHASQALKYGATMEELIETLELTSILGVHSVTIALPILREVEAQIKASSADNEPGEQS
jgi:alkylhydroperoxidase/carboxymuconolactone decarboxylase family protein YurZ